MNAKAPVRQDTSRIALLLAMAWAIPGAGHLWLGRRQKGLTFLVTLLSMFAFGLWLEGRLFPFVPSEPLVCLMAVADYGVGLPNLIARAVGAGGGRVVAMSYEYGNTFMIVAGLLNVLVIFDVYDVATGRK